MTSARSHTDLAQCVSPLGNCHSPPRCFRQLEAGPEPRLFQDLDPWLPKSPAPLCKCGEARRAFVFLCILFVSNETLLM